MLHALNSKQHNTGKRARMLTKAKAKLIQSLSEKKERLASGLFTVEGTKTVAELPASKITVNSLFATSAWIAQYGQAFKGIECIEVSDIELKKISALQTPQQVLALCELPQQPFITTVLDAPKIIALDGIQDPGNLGTIVRIADWYGITTLLCSPQCADLYNPKTLQASMGSFLRVNVYTIPLTTAITNYKGVVMGAVMNGANLHQQTLPLDGMLIIGNEGQGISAEVLTLVQKHITIPKWGGAESLNAGVATAIICDAWLRGSV
ncbi:MAG: RNA methyltransferase [Bacteroidia bacterium]|jgi:TrmH family RNA methyltransferase|nr:RNA methyltransferase [Bacteroidia bacterium]